MNCKSARRHIRNRSDETSPSDRWVSLEEHLKGCKSCSVYQEDCTRVAGTTWVKPAPLQPDELKESLPLPENDMEGTVPLLKRLRPAGVLAIVLVGTIILFALFQSQTPITRGPSGPAVQMVQIPMENLSGFPGEESRVMRVGGTDSYRLGVMNNRLTGRTVEDLASLLGGDTHSSVVKGNRREMIRLDVSLPPENSDYFLSKLSSLGDLTTPGKGILKEGAAHRLTIDIYNPE